MILLIFRWEHILQTELEIRSLRVAISLQKNFIIFHQLELSFNSDLCLGTHALAPSIWNFFGSFWLRSPLKIWDKVTPHLRTLFKKTHNRLRESLNIVYYFVTLLFSVIIELDFLFNFSSYPTCFWFASCVNVRISDIAYNFPSISYLHRAIGHIGI